MQRNLSTAEAARVLGLSEAQVRELLRSCVSGPRESRRYALTFQDLVILRKARELLERRVPVARVKAALRALSERPSGRPLSGVRIHAEGTRVAAYEGPIKWDPETGQTLFAFDATELGPAPAREPIQPRAIEPELDEASQEFQRAVALEESDPDAARESYRRVIRLDPEAADAYTNLGRLEHARGELEAARALYEQALTQTPEDPLVHFNLALSLEDLGQSDLAVDHYRRTLELDPQFADAHYNLGLLCERLGAHAEAVRHYAAYKRLVE